MATVTVSTWPEFVEAVKVAGDTVIIPEGTKWESPTGALRISCAAIQGNGVEISGLDVGTVTPGISVAQSATIEGLKITDCKFSAQLLTVAQTAQAVKFRNCTFSGRNTSTYMTVPIFAMMNTETKYTRCSFNIEGQRGYFAGNQRNILTALPYFRYCNIVFKGTSFSSSKADTASNGLVGTIKAFGSIIQGELGAKARLYQSENVLVTGFCTELQANYSRDILASKNAVQAIVETTEGDCSWLTTSQLGTVSELLDVYYPLFHKEGGI